MGRRGRKEKGRRRKEGREDRERKCEGKSKEEV